jgi:hypothetical protein
LHVGVITASASFGASGKSGEKRQTLVARSSDGSAHTILHCKTKSSGSSAEIDSCHVSASLVHGAGWADCFAIGVDPSNGAAVAEVGHALCGGAVSRSLGASARVSNTFDGGASIGASIEACASTSCGSVLRSTSSTTIHGTLCGTSTALNGTGGSLVASKRSRTINASDGAAGSAAAD